MVLYLVTLTFITHITSGLEDEAWRGGLSTVSSTLSTSEWGNLGKHAPAKRPIHQHWSQVEQPAIHPVRRWSLKGPKISRVLIEHLSSGGRRGCGPSFKRRDRLLIALVGATDNTSHHCSLSLSFSHHLHGNHCFCL